MPTVRIKQWTKDKLEVVRNEESHSSFDSVIKALLRDHEYAKLASQPTTADEAVDEPVNEPDDKAFPHLTVLAELTHANEGILFLWCPNCRNEVAHVVTDNPVSLPVFETKCQQCLSQLDHHGLVVAEIDHPVEEQLVENTLKGHLRACVIDYWDRMLERIGDESTAVENKDALIWQIVRYSDQYDWDWPTDVPVVGLEPGKKYVNNETDELVAVIEPASDQRNDINDLHIERWPKGTSRTEATTDLLERSEIITLLTDRALYLA